MSKLDRKWYSDGMGAVCTQDHEHVCSFGSIWSVSNEDVDLAEQVAEYPELLRVCRRMVRVYEEARQVETMPRMAGKLRLTMNALQKMVEQIDKAGKP